MTTKPSISHVLMTADAVGGVWNYALELCRGFGARGISVALATMGPRPSAAQRAEAAKLANVALHEGDFHLEWMSEPWDDVARAGEWLRQLADDYRPEVVHLNGYAHAALDWPVPTLVVAHSCVLSWWRAVRGGEAPAEWNRYRDAVREGLSAADLVVAPTAAMLESLRQNYGPIGAARVIPNGADMMLYRSHAKEPFVLSAGRIWDEAKNLDALSAVAPHLAWPVRIAGEMTPPDATTPPRPLGGPNLEYLGVRTPRELMELYARAAIYALPARYEPFGLTALEAALSGCALVLGDVPSLREIWGEAAWFVAPNDPAALRFALRQLIARPDLCADYGARARQRGAAFTARRMTQAYLQSYAWLREETARDTARVSAFA